MATTQLSTLDKRYGKPLVDMMTGGFERHIDHAGGVLQSFKLQGCEGDWLLIISAVFNEVYMVSFVGAVTAAGAVLAAEKKIRANELKWKKDKWKNGQ